MRGGESAIPPLSSSDLLSLPELGINVPLSLALSDQEFYSHLKKCVSDYNAAAALSSKSLVDFDDLHTRYTEYVEALKSFL